MTAGYPILRALREGWDELFPIPYSLTCCHPERSRGIRGFLLAFKRIGGLGCLVTLHMNGQSEVVIQGDRAIGETYCLVHQFSEKDGQRKCQTLGIRYYDQFLRQESRWYFVERKLVIDWSDSRISVP